MAKRKYASRLTKEELIRLGIMDIWYDSDEAKYHIINKNDREIKLSKGKQKYISFSLYDLDDEGNRIKIPVKKKFKNCKKEIDGYKYKTKNITLHRAAYVWFHGEIPEGYVVDHIDNKHETQYDSRLENLQLLTPEENLTKERPKGRSEIYCLMTKPLQYYLDKCNYWLMEYEREKEEKSSTTKYARKCRAYYCLYKKRIKYWCNHKSEYEEYNRLETARAKALQYQQERRAKIKQLKQEIKKAKEIDKALWLAKIKEYKEFLKTHPFQLQSELEKLYLDEINCN